MKDKGKYGGQMWKYLQKLVQEEVLTNMEVQNLCKLSQSWPKAFVVDYFTKPLKGDPEKDGDDEDEDATDAVQQMEHQLLVEQIKREVQNYDINQKDRQDDDERTIDEPPSEFDFSVYTVSEKLGAIKEIKNQINCCVQQFKQQQSRGDPDATIDKLTPDDDEYCEVDFDKFQDQEYEVSAEVMYKIEGDFESYIESELSEPIERLKNLPENQELLLSQLAGDILSFFYRGKVFPNEYISGKDMDKFDVFFEYENGKLSRELVNSSR